MSPSPEEIVFGRSDRAQFVRYALISSFDDPLIAPVPAYCVQLQFADVNACLRRERRAKGGANNNKPRERQPMMDRLVNNVLFLEASSISARLLPEAIDARRTSGLHYLRRRATGTRVPASLRVFLFSNYVIISIKLHRRRRRCPSAVGSFNQSPN